MKTISAETTFNTDLADFEDAFNRASGTLRAPVRTAQGQEHHGRHGDAQAQIGRISACARAPGT